MKSILLRVPDSLKRRLDAVRVEGYTLNGYILRVLARDLELRRRKGAGHPHQTE